MNYRKYVFSTIIFDETIRMYGEDIEFSLKAIRMGKLLVSRQLTYDHLGATADKDNVRQAIQFSAAIRYWLANEYPEDVSRVAVLWSITGITIGNILKITILRNVKFNLNCLLGHFAFLRMIILKNDLKQNF